MQVNKGLLAKCIAIPLLVGGLASFLTRGGMGVFMQLNQPPLSPPGWVFGVVWTILYILMGVSSYLVIQSGAEEEEVNKALSVYVYQLIVNFLWPTFFFNFQWYFFALLWLILLWIILWSKCHKIMWIFNLGFSILTDPNINMELELEF